MSENFNKDNKNLFRNPQDFQNQNVYISNNQQVIEQDSLIRENRINISNQDNFTKESKFINNIPSNNWKIDNGVFHLDNPPLKSTNEINKIAYPKNSEKLMNNQNKETFYKVE